LFVTAQPSLAQRGGGHGGGGHGGGGHGGWGRGGWGGGGWYGGYWYGDPFYYGPYYYGGLPYYYPAPAVPYYQPGPIMVTPGSGYEPLDVPRSVTDNTALIEVRVPADAEIWFDGTKTTQRGANRLFSTPPLTPGKTFTYEVRASWTVNGTTTTKTHQVQVEAGKRSWVSFADAGQLSDSGGH